MNPTELAIAIFQAVAALGQLAAVIILIIEFRRGNSLRKRDIHIQLELAAATQLFRTSIEYPHLNLLYTDGPLSPEETATRQIADFAELVLGFAEIVFTMRLNGDIDREEFATWMPWFYQVIQSAYLRRLWRDSLRLQYRVSFMNFMDALIAVMEGPEPLADKQRLVYARASQLLGGDQVLANWFQR